MQRAIGQRLRELRQRKGLTQKDLSLKVRGKIDYSYIGKIERGEQLPSLKMLPNGRLTPFFQATVEATEEAIINALVAAESMTGVNDHFVMALPHDRLVALLRKYNRLQEPAAPGKSPRRQAR